MRGWQKKKKNEAQRAVPVSVLNLFIHSFNQNRLSTYSVPSAVQSVQLTSKGNKVKKREMMKKKISK